MRLWQKCDVLRHRDGIGLWHVLDAEEGSAAIFIAGTRPEFLRGVVYKMRNEALGMTIYVSENNPIIREFNFVRREPVHG